MTTVVLDPGHGGRDPGAVGPTGLEEKTIALDIALGTARVLRARGVDVEMTRSDDRFIPLAERAAVANRIGAQCFVSIHINSADNPSAHGTETFAFRGGTPAQRLALAIQVRLVAALRLRDRGVKFADFQVLRATRMPAALVEVAFINNPHEEKLLRDPDFLDSAATAIAQGIIDWRSP